MGFLRCKVRDNGSVLFYTKPNPLFSGSLGHGLLGNLVINRCRHALEKAISTPAATLRQRQ